MFYTSRARYAVVMFIGHLPAGYVLTTFLQKPLRTRRFLFIGLVASVLPDADIFYFYLFDNQNHLHHGYWTHTPFYWALMAVVAFAILWISRRRVYLAGAVIFFSNVFLHLCLDTIVGKVEWLYPLTEKSFYLFAVPATHDWWVYNFLFHWTFLFEIVAVIWAIAVFFLRRKKA